MTIRLLSTIVEILLGYLTLNSAFLPIIKVVTYYFGSHFGHFVHLLSNLSTIIWHEDEGLQLLNNN